jgi:hypothetical protein
MPCERRCGYEGNLTVEDTGELFFGSVIPTFRIKIVLFGIEAIRFASNYLDIFTVLSAKCAGSEGPIDSPYDTGQITRCGDRKRPADTKVDRPCSFIKIN